MQISAIDNKLYNKQNDFIINVPAQYVGMLMETSGFTSLYT